MSLEGILAKLDRAKEHKDALKATIDGFASEEPHPLHAVCYYGNDIYGVEWVRRPAARWGTLVGDCVHNLRAILDHFVYDLAGGEGKAPRYSEFPIFKTSEDFFRRRTNGVPARGSGLHKIEGVSGMNARTAIKRLQPFNDGDPARHPLWIIHELDNFDKHRTVQTVVGWAHDEVWRLGFQDLGDLAPGWRQIKATQAPGYRAQLVGQKIKMKVRGDLAMRVCLPEGSPGGNNNLEPLLDELIAFVEDDVISSLAPHLAT